MEDLQVHNLWHRSSPLRTCLPPTNKKLICCGNRKCSSGNRVSPFEDMRVMAAIDESNESFYALKWALDNLFSFISPTALPETGEKSDGLLTVIHVQEPNRHFGFPASSGLQAYYPPSEVVDSVKKAQEQKSAAILKKASEMCKEKMITAKTLILDGDPKDMICQATEQIHVDLLVVGSRGLGKVKRAFLGSVSDYCAQHARCPILIVKPPKEDS